ncbi:MAG: amino acid ABC transporter substrate-binding protein [Alphaproteobacteria bacterium]|nr:MAG: amino acid ABC transporter substrate-binding protein [Alphaproteobacteria bacterium]
MRKSVVMAALAGLLAGTAIAHAADTKIGALMDVTGPLASFIPPLMNAANFAIKNVNDGGGLLDGKAVLVVGDSQAASQPAVDAATKLVNVENVPIIMGALASGSTIAAATAVTIPTATSPAMTGMKDGDHLFRLVPSDNYQGDVLAKVVLDEGIKKVAITYVNNDYGVGIANTFNAAFKKAGGKVTAFEKHEDKKNSYRSEIATLAKHKPDALVVIAYASGSGSKIVKQAIEGGFFSRFIGTDGLRDDELIKEVGADALKDSFFTAPTSPDKNEASAKLHAAFNAEYKEGADKPFVDQTYDATFLAALAVEKAGSADKTKMIKALRDVASAPGEVIGPGEWAKAKELIKAGKDINYEGAGGSYEFDANGDVTGFIGKFIVDGTTYKQIAIYK